MKREDVIALLRRNDVLKDLDDGPTAIIVSDGGKNVPVVVTKTDDFIKVSTGKIFRRTIRIPIHEIR